MGKFTEDLNSKLKHTEKSTYVRDQLNSYMTTFEWRNVEVSDDLGKFMKEGNSIVHYPFFSQTYDLLMITWKSIRSANKKGDSLKKILTSEYGIMAGFIAAFTAWEFLPKGVLSLLLWPFASKKNATEMQQHIGNYYEGYAARLETSPFYDHDYGKFRNELKQAYSQCTNVTWVDRFSYFCVTTELHARAWISKPFHNLFHDPENLVPPTTNIIVKFKINVENKEEAKQRFLNKITEIKDSAEIDIVNNHVHAKEDYKDSYTSIYSILRTSRYRAFMNTVKTLTDANMQIKKIAGNNNIQIKCLIDAPHATAFQQCKKDLAAIKDLEPLYDYGDRIHPNQRLCLFSVPVKKLQTAAQELENTNENLTVNFIHNF